MSLVIEIEEVAGSNVWVDIRARLTNLTGTPIISVTPHARGQLLAGIYTITFASVIAGTSALAKVETDLSKNPYRDQAGKSVALDGTTAADNIIGGLGIVFSASGSFTGSWSARIKVGLSFGAIGAYGSQAGQPGGSRKLRLFNDTGEALENLRIRNGLTARAKHFPTTATLIFDEMSDTADSGVEVMTSDQVQPYHITVANGQAQAHRRRWI